MKAYDTFHVAVRGSKQWCAVAEVNDVLTVGVGDTRSEAIDELDWQLDDARPRRATAIERQQLLKLLRMRVARAGARLKEVA